MDQPLKILFLAAEMVPFAKTGGLADVIGALPHALRALGHDVRVALPRYRRVDAERFGLTPLLPHFSVSFYTFSLDAAMRQCLLAAEGRTDDALPVYFIENDPFFDRDGLSMYDDDADRYIFFCRAALEGVRALGWCPDVIHCHDWQTAIVPNWLTTIFQSDQFFARTASVYTIHNLAYQGAFGQRVLEIAGVAEETYVMTSARPGGDDMVRLMARGIQHADVVTTVSPTYAREILTPEYGEGMETLLAQRAARLFGVLNGIDVQRYNPAADPYIAAQFDTDHLDGRIACKAALQRAFGLPERPQTPVIGAISRLTDQKGFDLLDAVIQPLLRDHDLQLVILGTGHQRYHERLSALRAHYPERLATAFTFNATLAHQIYAGADVFLMPSRFEPCGMGQLIALRYGAIPLVRATGGLADTVADCGDGTCGDGFVFSEYTPEALLATIQRALGIYADAPLWRGVMRRAMAMDWSWAASARAYVELYETALADRRAQ